MQGKIQPFYMRWREEVASSSFSPWQVSKRPTHLNRLVVDDSFYPQFDRGKASMGEEPLCAEYPTRTYRNP